MSDTTILIIEDDVIQREGLAAVLRQEGYLAVTAQDGKEALQFVESGSIPDLILLDMMIPPPLCDGWHFLVQRKHIPRLTEIPIIIMTGLGIASREWAISLGAVGLISKPCKIDMLLAEVKRCLTSVSLSAAEPQLRKTPST